MRHSEIRTERLESLRAPQESGKQAVRQSQDFPFNPGTAESDFPTRVHAITFLLCHPERSIAGLGLSCMTFHRIQ